MDVLAQLEERYNGSKGEAFLLNYGHYSVHIAVAYVVIIFSIQRWMRDREKYNLRTPLFLWSLTLALFSMATTVMFNPKLLQYTYNHGFERITCDCVLYDDPRTAVWAFMFTMAKVVELGDTLFIVLRKQKLLFLHWYHHISVMYYGGNLSYGHRICSAQSFMAINCFVHSIMYTYYAIRASGRYRPPIWVNMGITLLQLSQMIVGTYVNLYIYYRMTADPSWSCDGKVEKMHYFVYASLAMYASYFVLFAHFFYHSYISKKGEKTSVKRSGDYKQE